VRALRAAGLVPWVKTAIRARAALHAADRAHWLADPGAAALLSWLLWLSMDEGPFRVVPRLAHSSHISFT
jgi:hypothetical protein